MARKALLQTFAARWQMSVDQITGSELQARLGAAGEDVERLFALADEAKYSNYEPGGTDFQRWLRLIRGAVDWREAVMRAPKLAMLIAVLALWGGQAVPQAPQPVPIHRSSDTPPMGFTT